MPVHLLKKIASFFVELVFPRRCFFCAATKDISESFDLCTRCLAALPKNTPPFCGRCGAPCAGSDAESGQCGRCAGEHYYFERAVSACLYREPLKKHLHLFKYNKNIWLVKPFTSIMEEFFRAHFAECGIDLIVSAPTTSVRRRGRLYDQAHLLAAHLAKRLRIPYKNGLIRKKHGHAQTESPTRALRIARIQGAITLKDPRAVWGRTVLLVDDVVTTGATANEISKVLKDAHAQKIFVLTLARVDL